MNNSRPQLYGIILQGTVNISLLLPTDVSAVNRLCSLPKNAFGVPLTDGACPAVYQPFWISKTVSFVEFTSSDGSGAPSVTSDSHVSSLITTGVSLIVMIRAC